MPLDESSAGRPRRHAAGAIASLPRDFVRALAPDARDLVAKRFIHGTHRTEDPATTLARLLPRLAEFGITRVARITGFDRSGIEVVTVARPNARALSVANGKGLSRVTAKVSGIMEAIERWHAERPTIPLRFGDLADVAAPGTAVRVDLPVVRPEDYLGPLYWAAALDLRSGGSALVPFDAVHTCWLAQPSAPETPFYTSTDGLASGSHPVEATLHALCEVIERDACALFDLLPSDARASRRVDLAGTDDPDVRALADRLIEQGFGLALWDGATDLGTPVFLAALVDERAPRTPAGFGSGCHPNRAVAALRAITEAAQTRLIAITGTRDDLASELFAGDIGVRFRWALRERDGVARREWRLAPTHDSDDIRDDLRAVLDAVARAGCGPALAVDLSREPGLSVVRVLVPGLEAGGPSDGVLPGRRAARVREIFA